MRKSAEMSLPNGLAIAPEKVAHAIIKARELAAKVGAWNDSEDDGDAEEDPASILEDFGDDPTRDEFEGFVDALNDDEQAHLIALAWIGRGTYEPEELDEAAEMAVAEHANEAAHYLLSLPLLPDYLEEGLEKLGISSQEAEDDVM
jgi:hypothetical protein